MDPEAILARAEKALNPKLPAGFAFNRTVCLDRIRALQALTGYGRGYDEAVLRDFVEEASQNPQVYAAGLGSATGKSGPGSSAPQDATRDKANIGSRLHSSVPELAAADRPQIGQTIDHQPSMKILKNVCLDVTPSFRVVQSIPASGKKGVGGFIRKLFGRKRT